MTQTLMSSIPYVEAHHQGSRQHPKAIVIRLSETTSKDRAALGIAMTWHRSNSPVESCHYVVDEASVYQCVPDNVVAYPSSVSAKGSISINVCARPTMDMMDWFDLEHQRVLENTAALVSKLSSSHRVPVQYLDDVDESRWNRSNWFSKKGILLKTTGVWPFSDFLDKVKES